MLDTESQKAPTLFISHKHLDSAIADVIRDFVESRSAFRVKVHQSSAALAEGPRAGSNLNRSLIEALWETDALILVYTLEDHDWSYCMWECGVASHPQSPSTKIILFHCGAGHPALFNEQVNINIRDLRDIQKFTNDFLTSSDFFLNLSTPIAQCPPNSQAVIDAAKALYNALQPVLPPEKETDSEEWPAFPFLKLELSIPKKDELLLKSEAEDAQESCQEFILSETIIVDSDRYCSQLFNAMTIAPETRLKEVIKMWQENYPDSKSKWVEVLCKQILAAAKWSFPSPKWELMEGAIGGAVCFAPMVTRVRRIPNKQCMQFDVYFYKFKVDSGVPQI
jgi:hypothetical protein